MEIILHREKLLLQNSIMLSALYLDPRFHFLLNTEQKIEIQNHLRSLWSNLKSFQNQQSQSLQLLETPEIPSSSSSLQLVTVTDNDDDDLMLYLNEEEKVQIQTLRQTRR